VLVKCSNLFRAGSSACGFGYLVGNSLINHGGSIGEPQPWRDSVNVECGLHLVWLFFVR
jgi:hypothetical protein